MKYLIIKFMDHSTYQIARNLLEIKAVKLNCQEPFTWASGWKSPVYCDNRRTLSFPEVRRIIKKSFVQIIREHYPTAEVIAGVATGAIAQGALVADAMELPFVYVRSVAKSHGLGNQIEGYLETGKKVVVVEDLISTGGSSLSAVEALRHAGNPVLGMVAIFTYGFLQSVENFAKAGCELHTLTDYHELLQLALETGYIREEQLDLLKQWREAPDQWLKPQT
jgi:orotate phosphoribosyltransferase